MSSKGCNLFLGVLLSVTLILLTISAVSFFFSIQSHRRTGLEDSLCKCEHLHGNQSVIEPRIVNGTKFTGKHGLSWIVSIYMLGMIPSKLPIPIFLTNS